MNGTESDSRVSARLAYGHCYALPFVICGNIAQRLWTNGLQRAKAATLHGATRRRVMTSVYREVNRACNQTADCSEVL